MTVGWKAYAAVGAAVLGAGLVLYDCGTRKAPPPPAVATETSHDIGHVLSHEVLGETKRDATVTARRVVTRTVDVKPSGERIERTTTATTDTHADVASATAATVDARADTIHDAARVEVAAPPAPWLRLSLAAEWWTRDLALVPTARAQAEVRVLSPVLGVAPWVYVDVAPPVLGQRADVRAGVRLAREW